MTTQEVINIYFHPLRKRILIAILLFLFLCGLSFSFYPKVLTSSFYSSELYIRIIGIVSMILAVILLIFILRNGILNRKIGLIITKDGIIDQSSIYSSSKLIEWDKIEKIQQIDMQDIQHLNITLFNPSEFIDGISSKRIKKTLLKTQQIYGTPILIPLYNLQVNPSELITLMKSKLILSRALNNSNN